MNSQRIGVLAAGRDARETVDRIKDLERRGVSTAWLTTGGAGPDALSLFAAAAGQTDRIRMGTCIVPTWPRHPIVIVQQAQVINGLAPGRLRLGMGPSHKPSVETSFGIKFDKPLGHLREYLHIVRTLLHDGKVDFDGSHYRAHARIATPIPDLPVMASALQPGSYDFCGREADGAISWVSPHAYLRDVSLPTMKAAAAKAGRPVPPLIAHTPICVHDNLAEAREATRRQFGGYLRMPFYLGMLASAGFPNSGRLTAWTDDMLDAVLLAGKESVVGDKLRQVFDWGIDEVIAHVIPAGGDSAKSYERSVRLLSELAGKA